MNHFEYRDGVLHCEDVSLVELVKRVRTPVYVYSHATLVRHFQMFDQAFAGVPHLVCYSVKANSNLGVLAALFNLGAGADVVSGGELYRVLKAGGSADKVVFSGVGKREREMRRALEAGILMFNVESREELETLDRVAGEMGKRAPVALRVNPDVDAETHPYISTGLNSNKFGIPMAQAEEHYALAQRLEHIDVIGVDCHIGSQLTRTAPLSDALERVTALVGGLRGSGIDVRYIDIGGGLGIPYGDDDEPEPPSPAEYGRAVREALAPLIELGATLICEPGRVIAGNAGVLLTRVLYRKHTGSKHFTIVDAGFNDLMRPALYGSYHPMMPVRVDDSRPVQKTDVVGPICETGDFLARDRELPLLQQGELLCIGAAGAYGFSMASNYNSRTRPAEVMVSGEHHALIRMRETYHEMLRGEGIPTFV